MNAYELAQCLEDMADFDGCEYQQSANMLRQQADRIAELEKEVKRLVGAEPITHGKLTFCKNCGQQDPYAQTKPLSDAEILQFQDKVPYTLGSDLIEFARAIEERHGIK
tara:strand:- start:102 stop:428 length:327 start_codon:yes stop_codon:yes gene_type:complete